MAFNVDTFRSELALGGARPALFEVQLLSPIGGLVGLDGDLINKSPFMVRATNLPAQTVSSIPVAYFGRQVKVAGNRTFDDWTTTIINDEDFAIRNAMESWHQQINSHVENTRATNQANESYKATARVTQFDKEGGALRTYTFNGLFPINVSDIALSWDADGLEEFTVTWSYDYWTVSGSTAAGILPG